MRISGAIGLIDIGPQAANDREPAAEFAALARGPWDAQVPHPTPSGAIAILDAEDEILGWATDRAGHTSETVPPEGRAVAAIAATARAFAAARDMLAVLATLAAVEPLPTARLMILGVEPDPALSLAALRAREIQAQVFGAGGGR
jgi:hypothetical protein